MIISVVTVVKDDLAGLQRTCQSISSQTCESLQWVVVDGSSSDGTVAFLESLEDAQCRWISEPDEGIYDAMNKSLAMCTGDYVVFMNAGDVFYDEDVLELVMRSLRQRPDVLFGGALLEFYSGVTKYRAPRPMSSAIWHGLPANHQASYYRTDVLRDIPYDLSYPVCADYWLDCMLYQRGCSTHLLDRSLVRFRIGDTSYQRPLDVIREALAIQKNVLNLSLHRRMMSLFRRVIAMTAANLLNFGARHER